MIRCETGCPAVMYDGNVRRFKASDGQPPGVGFGSGTESSHAYFSTFLHDSNIIYTISYTDY